MSFYKLTDFKILGDERGSLISLEGTKNIPFEIKRVYYIFGTQEGVERGKHAHQNLQQILVAVSGSVTVVCYDGKNKKEEFVLNTPGKGLFIKDLIWHEMKDFSKDAVLMVLADGHYNESDYVRNYEDFLKRVK